MKSNKIKIGVDARILSGEINGIFRYTFENLKRMIHLRKDVEWHLFSASKIPKKYTQLLPRVKYTDSSICNNNFFGKMLAFLWSRFYLPYLLKKNLIDYFWSPAHRIPFFLSKEINSTVSIHDFVWKTYPESMKISSRFLEKILMPYSIKCANKVIVVSKRVREQYVSYNYPKNKIHLIYEGSFFERKRNTTKPAKLNKKKDNYFLFVGTIEPRKNIENLIKAYGKFLNDNKKSNLKFFIVGKKGWGNIDLKKQIFKMGLQNHVIIKGYVSDKRLKAFYKNAKFLALISHDEGFGLPVIESLSLNVPVLVSNKGALPEITGNCGIIINPNSIAQIASGIKNLNINKKNQQFKNKINNHIKKFSWDKSAQETLNLILK